MSATFDDIPFEIQEGIFIHLSPQDLKNCSKVCSKWRDVINSNQIWIKVCLEEVLFWKKYLQDTCTLLHNPVKRFSSEVNFAPLCYWKSHFNRYQFIKKNWRTGHFARSPLTFTPIHINEQFVIQLHNSEMIIWDISGNLNRFSSVDVAIPKMKVDNIIWKKDYIAYTQQRFVTCLKRCPTYYKQVLHIKLESGNCSQMSTNCLKSHLTLRLSDKFLLVQDPLNPCILSFYDLNENKLMRKVDLHRILGIQTLVCNCLEVTGDSVFLAYRLASNPFLVKYNFNKDKWENPIPLPNEAVQIYLSERFVCVKLSPESRESPMSILQIWDHNMSPEPTYDITEFYASKHLPVILTEDNLIIYHSRDEIKIHCLLTGRVHSFPVSRGVMKFSPIWEQYLVILDEKGVAVWNWHQGTKMYTPFRDECCSTFFVSETNIIVRRDDEQFFLISYW